MECDLKRRSVLRLHHQSLQPHKALGTFYLNTCNLKHSIRNTYPAVDENNRNSRPHRIGPEWKRVIYPAPLQKQVINSTLWLEHLSHYKVIRTAVPGEDNKACTPESLAMCLFTIDNDSKNESKEVTKEGCKYSPADCPSKYSPEYLTNLTTKSKHLSE